MAVVRTFVIKVEGSQAVGELNDVNQAIQGVDKSYQNMKKSQGENIKNTQAHATVLKGKAVPAMNEFTRIIQDAPYGMQGMANNIQQMTVQFGYLSTQAGGAGGALRAMLGSLMGPAGLVFAVTGVTLVLQKYGDQIWDFIAGTEEAESATEEFNKDLTAQKDILDELNGAFHLAAETAAAEAELAGKSAAEIYEIRRNILEAELVAIQKVMERDNEMHEQAQINARQTAGLEKEEIEEREKNLSIANDNLLDSEAKYRKAKLVLYRLELEERKRLAEESGDPEFAGQAGTTTSTTLTPGHTYMLTETEVFLDDMGALWAGYYAQQDRIATDAANREAATLEARKEANLAMWEATSQAMVNASIIAGKETEAGKALASAAVLVDAAVASVKIWRAHAANPVGIGLIVAQQAMLAATAGAALKQIWSADTNSGASTIGGGTNTVTSPSFNVVAGTQTSALSQALLENGIRIDQETPIKAYVTSTDVTSAQALDRAIINQASF